MKTKDFHIQSGSQFGARVAEMEDVKKAVAREVVSRVLWPHGMDPKNPIFLSDGSSSSYVWCYYLEKWVKEANDSEPLTVWTNNLDVPMQVLCQHESPGRVDIRVAPGAFSFKYCASFGDDSEKWVADHCKRSVCVLSVTALDAELGPCGKDDHARAIKRVILENANVLIVVADCTKLRKKRDPAHAAAPDLWTDWRDNRSRRGRLYVVTNLSTAANHFRRAPFKNYPDQRNADEIESENLWWLKEHLKDQLLIVG